MRIVFLHCFFLVILAIAAGCSSAIQSGSGTPEPLVRPNDTAHSTAVPATNPLGYEDLAVDAVDTFLNLLRSEDYEAAADFAISADYLPEEAIPELRDAVATGAIDSAAFRLQLEQWCGLSVCTEQPLGVSVLTSERGTVIVEAEWPNGLKSAFIVAFVEGTNVLGLPPLKVLDIQPATCSDSTVAPIDDGIEMTGTVDVDGNGTTDALFRVALESGIRIYAEVEPERWTPIPAELFSWDSVELLFAGDLNGNGGDELIFVEDGAHWRGLRIVTLSDCELVSVVDTATSRPAYFIYSDGGDLCYPGGCYMYIGCKVTDGGLVFEHAKAIPDVSLSPGEPFDPAVELMTVSINRHILRGTELVPSVSETTKISIARFDEGDWLARYKLGAAGCDALS